MQSIILPNAGDSGHLLARALNLTENSQQVAAENFVNSLGIVTAIEQCLRDLGQVGGRVDSFGCCSADAIKIRTKADVIDTCDLGDVIDIIDQRLERWTGNLGGPFALNAVLIEIGYRL